MKVREAESKIGLPLDILMQAVERTYRYPDGIPAVLDREQSEELENDFLDMGLIYGRPCISIRGSDDSKDWKENLFLDFSTNLYGRITSWVEFNGHKHKNILILGHSRGGAIGYYLAEYLTNLGYKITLVTFGCPKVKPDSRILFPHFRVTNGADGVPRLPPKFYSWKSKHRGYHIELDSASLWRKSLLIIGILTRHFIKDYQESYNKLDLR